MSMWGPAGYDDDDRDRDRDHGSTDHGRSPDPYAADGTWGQDPYATSSFGAGQYGSGADPYGTSGSGQYESGAFSHSGFDSFSSPSGPAAGAGHGSFGPAYGPGPAWPASSAGYTPPPTSAMALTGFLIGLASLILCSGLLSPVGLVFSILGMRDTAPSAEPTKAGRGFAIAGLVTSILGTILLAFFVLVVIVALVAETA